LAQCLGVLILKWHQYHSKSILKKISWSLYKNFWLRERCFLPKH
jgi:hypothetical protein